MNLNEVGKGCLDLSPFTIRFSSSAVEDAYLAEIAKSRLPVLVLIFGFDCACYVFRLMARMHQLGGPSTGIVQVAMDMGPQPTNLALLVILIGLLNKRSRRQWQLAAWQEETVLAACMALAISNLLYSLRADNSQDYIYATFFLICTSCFLQLRWWVGTLGLAVPLGVASVWWRSKLHGALPEDAMAHIIVAWAVGGLMAYLAEGYRREVFASKLRAKAAHDHEVKEVEARVSAQHELAQAQAQAAQRAVGAAREKGESEAKSELMSLLCHEVRTPLNGCLASAEMLLETELGEEQRELANTIRVSGSILMSTVSNFLDFFKMDAGKALDIVRTEVDLTALVCDVHCIIVAMLGKTKQVQLLPPDLGVGEELHTVMCDPDRVRGVLLNLYTNAAKYTKEGHIRVGVREVGPNYQPTHDPGYSSITVKPAYQACEDDPQLNLGDCRSFSRTRDVSQRCLVSAGGADSVPGSPAAHAAHASAPQLSTVAEEGAAASAGSGAAAPAAQPGASAPADPNRRWLLFDVKDTGIGIAPKSLHSLFREYEQGTEDDVVKPRSKGGTGLGLSICAKQVAVLGGLIGAYSAPGKGSVFWFTVPVLVPEGPVGPVEQQGAGDGRVRQGRGKDCYGQLLDSSSKPEPPAANSSYLRSKDVSISKEWMEPIQAGSSLSCPPHSQHTPPSPTASPSASGAAWNNSSSSCSDRTASATSAACIPPLMKALSVQGALTSAEAVTATGARSDARAEDASPLHGRAHGQQPDMLASSGSSSGQAQGPRPGSPCLSPLPAPLALTPSTPATPSASTPDPTMPHAGAGAGTRGAAQGGSNSSNSALPRQQQLQWDALASTEVQMEGCGEHAGKSRGGQVDEALRQARGGREAVGAATQALHAAAAALQRLGTGQPQPPLGSVVAGVAGHRLAVQPPYSFLTVPNFCDEPDSCPGFGVGRVPPPHFRKDTQHPELGAAGKQHKQQQQPQKQPQNEPGAGGRQAAASIDVGKGPSQVASSNSLQPAESEPDHRSASASQHSQPANVAPAATITHTTHTAHTTHSATTGQALSCSGQGALHIAPPCSARPIWPSATATLAALSGGRTTLHPSIMAALKGRTVLLVEDNAINQTVARKMLTGLGLLCEVVSDGVSAVAAVEKAWRAAKAAEGAGDARDEEGAADAAPAEAGPVYDVILMDMVLPGMSGVAAARAIRLLGVTTPILAMTANVSAQDQESCLAAGMDGFLSKPVLKGKLVEALARVVQTREDLGPCTW